MHPRPIRNVEINGVRYRDAEIAMLETLVGPMPDGSFWYDARSGLWGLVGGGAAGQMLPNLPLGAMAIGCSGCGSGVFLNGREITPAELLIYGPIACGRYFLDADGSAGPEGGRPVVNLLRTPKRARRRGHEVAFP
jgi:hypothetical protein